MRWCVAVLSLVAVLAVPRVAGAGTKNTVQVLDTTGVGSILAISDSTAPSGVSYTVKSWPKIKVRALCTADGWRVRAIQTKLYPYNHATETAWVQAAALMDVSMLGTAGARVRIRAACEAGDASVVLPVSTSAKCKRVKGVMSAASQPGTLAPAQFELKCQGFPKAQDKKPLRLYWSGAHQDNWTSHLPGSAKTYSDKIRLEGDMLLQAIPGKTKPLKIYWSEANQDYLTTTNPAPGGYTLKWTAGHVYATNQSGLSLVPLKLYYHSGRKDYMTTGNPKSEQAAKGAGYTLTGAVGYVFKRY